MAAKRGFLDGYKTYDPQVEGFGSAAGWRDGFHERMGFEQAVEVLRDASPWGVLGVARDATWEAIKKAYRRLMLVTHPDRGGDVEACKRVQAAYAVLAREMGR